MKDDTRSQLPIESRVRELEILQDAWAKKISAMAEALETFMITVDQHTHEIAAIVQTRSTNIPKPTLN